MTQGLMIVSFAATFLGGLLVGALLSRSQVILKVGGTIEVQGTNAREVSALFRQAQDCLREAHATTVKVPR